MAKDPAMLWYWNDWHSGTALLSRFLKGCYMDLLHAQFNHGRLSLEEIKICCGSDFGTAWPALQKKFKQDENGLFFNERLEQEKEKRQNFTESRRNNLKNSHMHNHMKKHMEDHMENANENEDESKDEKKKRKKFEKPDHEVLMDFFQSHGSDNSEASKFWNYYESNGWKVGKNPMKDWQAASRNWISKKFINGTPKQNSTHSGHTSKSRSTDSDYAGGL